MNGLRGQSTTLSVVLLIGIILTTATGIAVIGGDLIEDISGSAEQERASQEMTQFASESAAVALGGSDQRQMQFDASAGTVRVRENASWVCVEKGNATDREFILPEPDGPNVDNDATCGEEKTYMGSVVYDTGEKTVAYEGGGVWSSNERGGSRMISPPEFHYREDTLTLPVVNVSGDVDRGGSTVNLAATAGPTEDVDHGSNPLPETSGRVYVTIGSQYYEAWGDFMADRTDGRVVEFDHDNETVTVELVVPSPTEINQAVYASDGGDNAVNVYGGISDSYDSSESPPKYESPAHKNKSGPIVSNGGITTNAVVHGNIYSIRQGGQINIAPSSNSEPDVVGDIHGQQDVKLSQAQVKGDIYADETVNVQSTSYPPEVDGDIHSGDVVKLKDVTVTGDVYADEEIRATSGTQTIEGDTHTYGRLKVSGGGDEFKGKTYVDGELDVKKATFGDAVHATGSGDAAYPTSLHDSTVSDSLYVSGSLKLKQTSIVENVDVTGDAKVIDTDIGGDLHVDGELEQLKNKEVDGDVHVTGDATLESVSITGDLHVGGDLTCQSNPSIDGDVRVSGNNGCQDDDGDPNLETPTSPDAPEEREEPESPTLDPPAVEVPEEGDLKDIPDECRQNGQASNQGIIISGRECTLEPGKYKVPKIDIDGDGGTNLKIDTSEGETVELYVGGSVSLTEDAEIVTGNPDHNNASELEINVYDEDASVDIQSNVTGVINANGTKVDIDSGGNVFGAVIAEKVDSDGTGGVHYDEALAGKTVGDGKNGTTSVQYLHVTRNEMTVED